MREYLKFYIDGKWVDPVEPKTLEVDNPTTEQASGRISLGSAADVDKAVKAARKAFGTWSQSTREERLDLLQAILAEYQKRAGDLAGAVSEEMGAPASLAAGPQVALGVGHLANAIDVLKNFPFEEQHGATLVIKEPIGVCGLITPWNWPINQIACKVYPALATGCTMVLKPSEVAPYSAQIFTEIVDAAGVPAGVYNLVYGDGPGVGAALSSHPDIDMVSFTGSTRAGVDVARNAATTVKRVTQELGGKSPNIVLDDSDFAKNVAAGVAAMMLNSGQSCNAPSRMLVPNARKDEAIAVAREAAGQVRVGDPDDSRAIGPVVSKVQFDKIQGLIKKGIDEGATVVAGGPGRPDGLDQGLLRQAHRLRRRHQRHDHRARGDLRAGAVHSRLRRRRSGRRDRQRHRLRLGRLCLVGRPRQGAGGGPQDPRRLGGDQPRLRHERALRRLQEERQRP